jgi:hypothetical protein
MRCCRAAVASTATILAALSLAISRIEVMEIGDPEER